MTLRSLKKCLFMLGLLVGVLFVPGSISEIVIGEILVNEANAHILHPATPLSIAGVAHRTTRRVIRRSNIYVNTLPAACAQVTINGALVWQCGTTYYQPYGGRYVVGYVD